MTCVRARPPTGVRARDATPPRRYALVGAGALVTLNTLGSNYDAVLRIYDGCPLSGGKEVARDDDSGGGQDAKLSLTLPMGSTFYVMIEGYGAEAGSYVVSIGPCDTVVFAKPSPPPPSEPPSLPPMPPPSPPPPSPPPSPPPPAPPPSPPPPAPVCPLSFLDSGGPLSCATGGRVYGSTLGASNHFGNAAPEHWCAARARGMKGGHSRPQGLGAPPS